MLRRPTDSIDSRPHAIGSVNMHIVDTLRVSQLTPLDVVGVDVVADVYVYVDEYIPLRFRTYRDPLGVSYFRLGNYRTTLAELAVEPRTHTVRGLTVMSISSLSPWPRPDLADVEEGLPVIPESLDGGEVVDLPHDFSVASHPGEIVVFWRQLVGCRGARVGNACFLITDSILSGVWFTGLTKTQTHLFNSQACAG